MSLNNNKNKLPNLDIYLILVPNKYRHLFLCYLKYIELLAKRALKLKKTSSKNFIFLQKAVFRNWKTNSLLGELQKEFIKENISLSLLSEPIEGFSWIYDNRYELDFNKATPMFLQIISPISRLITDLNNETPLLYHPLSNLIFSYFSLYLEENLNLIKIFKNNKINFNSKDIDKHLSNITSILNLKMHFNFKLKIIFFVGFYKVLTINKPQKINFYCYVNSFLYGLYYNIIIANKNKNTNQI